MHVVMDTLCILCKISNYACLFWILNPIIFNIMKRKFKDVLLHFMKNYACLFWILNPIIFNIMSWKDSFNSACMRDTAVIHSASMTDTAVIYVNTCQFVYIEFICMRFGKKKGGGEMRGLPIIFNLFRAENKEILYSETTYAYSVILQHWISQ